MADKPLELPKGIKTLNNTEADEWMGPYTSKAHAMSIVPVNMRLNRVVRIDDGNGKLERWQWVGGTTEAHLEREGGESITQATETTLGVVKLSTQPIIQDEATTDDETAVTPKKFWFGLQYFLTRPLSWLEKQEIKGGMQFVGTAGEWVNKILRTDGSGNVTGENWDVKEDSSNKKTDIAANIGSNTFFGTIKAWADYFKSGWASLFPSKTTAVNADEIIISDSEDSGKTKRFSFANLVNFFGAKFHSIGGVAFPRNTYGQGALYTPHTGDYLAAATSKFTVTLSKNGGAPTNVPSWALFNNNYDQNYVVADAGESGVVNINFDTKSYRLTQLRGFLVVHCYFTYAPKVPPVVRAKRWTASTGGTETVITLPPPENISVDSAYVVYKYALPDANWLSDIEITFTAKDDKFASAASIEYYPISPHRLEDLPVLSNYPETNRMYRTIEFRDSNNVTRAKISPNGAAEFSNVKENGQNLVDKYEPKIATKNTAFNKNFGTTAGTVAEGNDSRFHSHSNKSVLDGITAGKVTSWDGKADAANVYTKTEVDAKVSSVYKIKGSVATVAALPTTGNVIGDVYNVIATGQNYVWVGGTDGDLGNGWDSLGGSVDLSGYYTKVESLDKFEPKIVSKNDAFNKKFGEDADNVARGNHTHNLSSLNNDVNFQTYDDVDTVVREAIADLKAGVSTEGDTLKKLYDLIISSLTEIHVDNIPERDNLNITKLPTNVFVLDDGDGRWALYKATATGINASFVKISDPDLLNAVMSASQIKSAYESNPNTNAFSNVYKNRLEYIATLAEADQVQNSGQDRTYNVNGRELLIGNALLLTLQTILGTGLKLKNNGEVEVLSTNQLAAKFKRGNGVRLYNTDGKELTLHNEAATQDISIKVPDEGGSRFMATREWVELTKYAYENIADGEDLNDYRTSGLFNLNRDYSYYANTPTQGDAFVFALLRITKIDGGAVQEIIGLDTANDRLNTFKRFYNKEYDYWTEWQKTITSNEVSDTQMYNWTIAYNAMTSLQNGVAKYTKTTGASYNVLPTDYIVSILGGTTTSIYLPSIANIPNGKTYKFCFYGDFSGNDYSSSDTSIYAASGEKIHSPSNDNIFNWVLLSPGTPSSTRIGELQLLKDSTGWIILSFSGGW